MHAGPGLPPRAAHARGRRERAAARIVGAMNEQFAPAGDVTLCFETFGEPERPAILLIMGLATQMLAWHEDFCTELAERGFFVIRYDNRDIGRSTHFDGVRPPGPRELLTRKPKELAYTLEDMADDGIALLDHLGISAAHVVGASMGGMIAQLLAVRHPARVLSLTSIMSTTGHRWKGQPALRVYPFFVQSRPKDKRRGGRADRQALPGRRLARLRARRGRAARDVGAELGPRRRRPGGRRPTARRGRRGGRPHAGPRPHHRARRSSSTGPRTSSSARPAAGPRPRRSRARAC